MSVAIITGKFMGANLHTSRFDGVEKHSVQIDIYQPHSPTKEKALTVRCDDLTQLDHFREKYTIGDDIQLRCTLNAYRNDVYYKFLDQAVGV